MGRKSRAALERGYLPQYITVWRRRHAMPGVLPGKTLIIIAVLETDSMTCNTNDEVKGMHVRAC
jgi:hypothetical protein